jgi:hypothetical protein
MPSSVVVRLIAAAIIAIRAGAAESDTITLATMLTKFARFGTRLVNDAY